MISKVKVACEVSGHEVLDHFADVSKMVDLGSGRVINEIRKSPADILLIVNHKANYTASRIIKKLAA